VEAADFLEIGLRRGFSKEQSAAALRSLSEDQVTRLAWAARWAESRHEHQIVPEDEDGSPWSVWLILGGRGAGKTRVGAEWLGMAAAMTGRDRNGKRFRGLVSAPTNNDLKNTCYEGESGLLSVIPSSLIKDYNINHHQIKLMNGSLLGGISAEKSSRFRGPQWHRAWCLHGSSMVLLDDGTEARIDAIQVGDRVATPEGSGVVKAHAMTNPDAGLWECELDDGTTLCGTLDHPVWVQGKGFTWISKIMRGDRVILQCSTTDYRTASDALGITSCGTGSLLGTKADALRSTFIASSTKSITGLFRRILSCITLTKTNSTTTPEISLPSAVRGIISNIRSASSSLCKPLRRAWLGCESGGKPRPYKMPVAAGVAQSFNPDQGLPQENFAPVRALNGFVVREVAVKSVARLATRGPVYDITVDGGEFFANGVLVHNCDELAAWGDNGRDPQEAWDTMALSVRLGHDTRILATTTPRPLPHIKALLADTGTVVTTASTYVNLDNLSPEFRQRILKYEGTRIGRQEIHAELIDSEEGGIVSRDWIRKWPRDKPFPAFEYVVMSLDTAYSEESYDKKTQETDPSACSVWGGFVHKGKPGIMLLDCWAERLGFPDLVDTVLKEKDVRYGSGDVRPEITPPRLQKGYKVDWKQKPGKGIDLIVIEGKASGKSLRQQLMKEKIPTYEYNPGKASKLTRLHVASWMPHDGIIWIPESVQNPGRFTTWAEPLLEQVCSYAGEGTVLHDDLLDTATQAWRVMEDQWLRACQARLDKIKRLDRNQLLAEDVADLVPKGRTSNPYAS
jgi:phage terminase large subunit-like protein